MKHKLLCLSLLFIHAGAYAANCCSHFYESANVGTYSPEYTFEAGFRALVVKPSSNHVLYAAEAFPEPLPSPNWQIFSIKPDYDFGFDLTGSVMLHEQDSVLFANWTRFKATSCAQQSVPTADMVGPFFEIGPDASRYKNARGNITFKFNEFNIDYGQHLNMGERLATTLFCGVRFADIKQKLVTTFANNDATTTRTITTPSTFTGAGPELGIDFTYCIDYGLHLTGSGTAALLTGKIKTNTIYASTAPELSDLNITPPNIQHTNVCSVTQTIPAFKEQLGLAYIDSLCDCLQVRLEVGYQAQIYIDALQSIDMGSQVPVLPAPGVVGVFARTFQRNTSNFALSGPYVNLDIGF